MNVVFIVVMVIGIGISIAISPENALNSMITGASNGFNLAIKLLPIYAVWLSILALIEQTRLNEKLAKIFKPLIKLLFKNTTPETNNYLAVNMTANFLGMGGAGTKAGISAIQSMDNGETKANDNMLMLFVLNCTSIQLIPTTIIALRGVNGSIAPSDIILPALINTIITTTVGVILVKICSKKK